MSEFTSSGVVAGLIAEAMPGVLAHAMQRKHFGAGDVFLITPQDHATLAGHDILGDVEAEAAEIAEGARRLAAELGLDGVGADLLQRVEVAPHREPLRRRPGDEGAVAVARGLLVGTYANGKYTTKWIDRQGDHGAATGAYFPPTSPTIVIVPSCPFALNA